MPKLPEKRDLEVDNQFVDKLTDKGWHAADMKSQLYQILCGCALPKSTAQQKLMALEGRENTEGYTRTWVFMR